MNDYIGIDISKASLQVYIPKGNIDLEIDNTKQGLKKLTSKLKKLYGKTASSLIWIYEPTGSYWTTIKKYCHENTISCFIVKPLHILYTKQVQFMMKLAMKNGIM